MRPTVAAIVTDVPYGHFDRLEAKFDGLTITLARSGHPTGPDDSDADD